MSAPLTIRFATDHAGAKSGIQDLAASVVSNMVKVSESLGIAANANGGYLNTVKTLATNVASDFGKVGAAGIKAANDSNYSAVATVAAVGKAASETKIASVATTGALAVAGESAKFHYAVIRNEAAATARLIATSPLLIGAAVGVTSVVASFMLVSDAVGQANAQIDKFIKLGEQAESAGVSVEFWQRFSDGAKKAKIEVAEVETALKTAAKAVTPKFGEDDQVKKRLQEIFESGYAGSYQSKGLADYNAATTNEGRIRATITAMQEMKSLGMDLERIDVGARMFGPDFADRIRTGKVLVDELVAGLDKPRDDLIKDEEVRRAEEFRDRLNEAYKQIDDFLHVSTMLEGSGRAVLDLWLGIAEAVAKGTVNASNFYTKIQDMQDGLSKLLGLPISLGNAFETIGSVAAGTSRILAGNIQDDVYGTRKIYDKPIGPELPPPAPNAITNPPAPPRRALDLYLNPPAKAEPKGGSKSGAESLDAVETFINGLEKTAAATKAEAEAFGKSNAEKAVAINLAKLKETADQKGIAVTDAQTAKVTAASEATAKYKDAIQNLEQAERQAAEASRFLWGGIADNIADAVLNGKSFANVIADLSKMTIRSGIQALLTGQGPLAGIIGTAPQASAGGNAVGGLAGLANSFISGFRASGGPVKKGQGYTVGELGQELFVPSEDGFIMPAGRGGGGGGGAPVLNFIDQRPAGSADLAPTTRRNASGGTDILLREAESSIALRGRRGQGPLAAQLNTAATRTG